MWLEVVTSMGTTGYFLRCRVPDTGSYTVAPSSLALLPQGMFVGITLARVSESDVQVGGDAVQVVALDEVSGGGIRFDP